MDAVTYDDEDLQIYEEDTVERQVGTKVTSHQSSQEWKIDCVTFGSLVSLNCIQCIVRSINLSRLLKVVPDQTPNLNKSFGADYLR